MSKYTLQNASATVAKISRQSGHQRLTVEQKLRRPSALIRGRVSDTQVPSQAENLPSQPPTTATEKACLGTIISQAPLIRPLVVFLLCFRWVCQPAAEVKQLKRATTSHTVGLKKSVCTGHPTNFPPPNTHSSNIHFSAVIIAIRVKVISK